MFVALLSYPRVLMETIFINARHRKHKKKGHLQTSYTTLLKLTNTGNKTLKMGK